ncbi:MAG: hypothetical protein PHY12_12105 [Eubacteriales bacterium]|nr:hypothetical protein [Eubacteriales bacterium]
MLVYGPTGALSEYQYKNGVFHGVHYGDYQQDSQALFEMIDKEEAFLLQSPQKRRILFDLYHTALSPEVVDRLVTHVSRVSSRIIKVAFAAERGELRKLKSAMKKNAPIPFERCMFDEDQDTDKTWLVTD